MCNAVNPHGTEYLGKPYGERDGNMNHSGVFKIGLGVILASLLAGVSLVAWQTRTNITAVDAHAIAHCNTKDIQEVKVELRASNEKIDLNQTAILREFDQQREAMKRIEDKLP